MLPLIGEPFFVARKKTFHYIRKNNVFTIYIALNTNYNKRRKYEKGVTGKMRLNLLIARKKTGLTQRQIAEKANISLDKYSNIEVGRQLSVDSELAKKISHILQNDSDTLFLCEKSYKTRTKSKGA